MAPQNKVRYLKIDRGRYFYQRRVPQDLQEILVEKVWSRPCGDVSYSKAVQLVVTWAEEHDQFISSMKPLEARQEYATRQRRTEEQIEEKFVQENRGAKIFNLPIELEELSDYNFIDVAPNWTWAKLTLNELESDRSGDRPSKLLHAQLWSMINRILSENAEFTPIVLPPYPEFKELLRKYENFPFTKKISFSKSLPAPMAKDDYLDRLHHIYQNAFGESSPAPPADADEKDEHDFIKRKLERKISELSPDLNTITAVSEKYFIFNNIRKDTRSKYRRDLGRLVELTGDIPVKKIETSQLKTLRDQLAPTMKPASLHAVFTPIKGMLRYAVQEELVDINPISAVALPKDKRPIEERKWQKFEPDEAARIDRAVHEIWGHPTVGLSDERRKALFHVVRALMFTGMRPIEVLRLQAQDVTDRMIKITGSKTESSTRVIPLHPELSEFPEWVRSGGLRTFDTIKTDQVGSVRHNFARLIRDIMSPPITDKQKALYSLRATFVNAMRRAGADIQMQRAILGHKEAGAIRHYDDGPEFAQKYQMVAKTDPRRKD
ncbi:hypothetical protein ACEN2R_09550 [Pseudogemmobacter sp. W21_MBD1_M6]